MHSLHKRDHRYFSCNRQSRFKFHVSACRTIQASIPRSPDLLLDATVLSYRKGDVAMRVAQLLVLAGVVPLFAGCTMCSSCDDYNYSAFGGAWQRTDMQHGRVGSAFTAAGVKVLDTGPELRPAPAEPTAPNVEELTQKRSFWAEDEEGEAEIALVTATETDGVRSANFESAVEEEATRDALQSDEASKPFPIDDPLAEDKP
jgi:hypothetical protein